MMNIDFSSECNITSTKDSHQLANQHFMVVGNVVFAIKVL